MIILSGLFGFGMSIYLIAADSNDLWDLFLLITGLVGVPLAGVFAVGIFTSYEYIRCADGINFGIIFAYIFNGMGGGNSPFYVSIISFIVAFVFSYIISIIVPGKQKDITGLTIYDIKEKSNYVSIVRMKEDDQEV